MDDSVRFSDSVQMLNQKVDLSPIFLPEQSTTEKLGRIVGTALRAGDVVLLDGPIGSGKTAFVRAAIADRMRYSEEIPSPTFTLVQTYEADERIWHSDLYRLSDPDEIAELGLEEAFVDSIVFIEWPDRLGPFLPDRYIAVSLAPEGNGRRADISLIGESWSHILATLKGNGFA